jgi:hypothetical protein
MFSKRDSLNAAQRLRLTAVGFLFLGAFLTSPAFARGQGCSVSDKPVAIKGLELGRVSNREFVNKAASFFDSWRANYPNMQLYIINYGTDKGIARRERLIIKAFADRDFDRSRVTLVRGGRGDDPKSVFWKIPPGADNPAP